MDMNTPNQSGSHPSTDGLAGSAASSQAGHQAGQKSDTYAGSTSGARSTAQDRPQPGEIGGQGRTAPTAANELQDKATELARQAKSQGKAELEQYRQSAVGQVETLAESARAAANTLKGNDTLGLSHYVVDVADGMQRFAANLRGQNLDELMHQASHLARRNPTLFIAGSIALGFGLTRFIRASRMPEDASTPSSYHPGSSATREPQPGSSHTAQGA